MQKSMQFTFKNIIFHTKLNIFVCDSDFPQMLVSFQKHFGAGSSNIAIQQLGITRFPEKSSWNFFPIQNFVFGDFGLQIQGSVIPDALSQEGRMTKDSVFIKQVRKKWNKSETKVKTNENKWNKSEKSENKVKNKWKQSAKKC